MTAPVVVRRRSRSRANPEHKLQVQVRNFLTYCLPLPGAPDYVEWTSSLAGAHLSITQRNKAKAGGLRPGFPDLMFILPDRTVRFIELKTSTGVLSSDQKRVRDMLRPDCWSCCRSLEEVEATLTSWGLTLRNPELGRLFAGASQNRSAGVG